MCVRSSSGSAVRWRGTTRSRIATHGPPGDSHQRAERRLVRPLGQIGDLLLEVVGEPGLALGPRDELDDHTATGAVDAPERVSKPHPVRTDVEVAPIALASVVNGAYPAQAA